MLQRRLGHAAWVTETLALLPLVALGGCPPPSSRFAHDLAFDFNVGGRPTAIIVDATPVFTNQPIFESVPGKVASHAPTVTAFPDGELLAAWYSYGAQGELDGSAIYTARRLPTEDKWEPATLHIDRPEADGNPVLYSEADAVWFFQAVAPDGWSTAHIEMQRSPDRGHTWTAPRALGGPLGSNARFPPVRLADGTLLLPAYDDLLQRALFFASADGNDWTLRSALATAPPFRCIQPSVVELGGGRLLAIMRNTGRGWLWVTASDDGGLTWASPRDSGFPNPASATALLRLAGGHLILIYNDSNTDRHPLSITISGDEGVTWYPPRALVDGDGAYAYPAAVQTPDGLIQIVYSHNRERIGHITLNEAWIVAGE
jgi:predicted neuraminidase